MKTIKQIADELGVSKTAINKKIDNLGLRSSLRKNGNQFAIDEEQESLIKSAFLEKETQTENRKPVGEKTESLQLVYDMVYTLRNQLEEKDKQIKHLQEALKNTTEALAFAQESVKAAQLLQANAEKKLLEQQAAEEEQAVDEPVEQQAEPEKGIWSKLKEWIKI